MPDGITKRGLHAYEFIAFIWKYWQHYKERKKYHLQQNAPFLAIVAVKYTIFYRLYVYAVCKYIKHIENANEELE